MFRHILVPLDGSTHSQNALEKAADLALHYKAKISVLHVITDVLSSRVPDELRDYAKMEHVHVTEKDMLLGVARKLVEKAELQLRELGLIDIALSIDTGNVASKIVEFSQENDVDLIVMGRRGLGDLGGLLIGSVSHKVCHLADCACLTVK